ncbi:hypothetical protein [Sphingomonas turrisvirgatae]|uniref:Uncharacterized protein n=1 Tax=Sphingomonas turrisvirgatae TaxID=1888892 RepID=A0A1E3LR00_9SPHN|nr:hypothetical protein [Sphingomonas turrisvirgatae]ODP36197.1 hypothetical protein BFL28_07250 [Sphingomonas turrisvirgatae]
MTFHTVNTSALNSVEAEQYFTGTDRRYMTGLRATLEMLGLPLPDYAMRQPAGRRPAKAVMAAYQLDNHSQRHPAGYRPRRENASSETVAAARAKSNRNQ